MCCSVFVWRVVNVCVCQEERKKGRTCGHAWCVCVCVCCTFYRTCMWETLYEHRQRWKGSSGWAGSEEQKTLIIVIIIWFIRCAQIRLIRRRTERLEDEGGKVDAKESEAKWKRDRWSARANNEERESEKTKKCTSGREAAVNNWEDCNHVVHLVKQKPQPQFKQTVTPYEQL